MYQQVGYRHQEGRASSSRKSKCSLICESALCKFPQRQRSFPGNCYGSDSFQLHSQMRQRSAEKHRAHRVDNPNERAWTPLTGAAKRSTMIGRFHTPGDFLLRLKAEFDDGTTARLEKSIKVLPQPEFGWGLMRLLPGQQSEPAVGTSWETASPFDNRGLTTKGRFLSPGKFTIHFEAQLDDGTSRMATHRCPKCSGVFIPKRSRRGSP